MDFEQLIKQRYSVRHYKDTQVEDEKLQEVLNAARLAPSAANRQPIRIVVIRTKDWEDKLRTIYNRDWFIQAPIIICVVGLPGKAWTRYDGSNYYLVDAAIAMDHMILAAANLGLGTCWIAAFNPDAAKEVLNLSDNEEPVVFTPLGYPADQHGEKERKELQELVQYIN